MTPAADLAKRMRELADVPPWRGDTAAERLLRAALPLVEAHDGLVEECGRSFNENVALRARIAAMDEKEPDWAEVTTMEERAGGRRTFIRSS